MNRPALLWLWPEFLLEIPKLSDLLNSFAKVTSRNLSSSQLASEITDYDVLVPPLEHESDATVLYSGRRLRVIGTPSTGSGHITVVEAKRRGIKIVTIKNDHAFLDQV